MLKNPKKSHKLTGKCSWIGLTNYIFSLAFCTLGAQLNSFKADEIHVFEGAQTARNVKQTLDRRKQRQNEVLQRLWCFLNNVKFLDFPQAQNHVIFSQHLLGRSRIKVWGDKGEKQRASPCITAPSYFSQKNPGKIYFWFPGKRKECSINPRIKRVNPFLISHFATSSSSWFCTAQFKSMGSLAKRDPLKMNEIQQVIQSETQGSPSSGTFTLMRLMGIEALTCPFITAFTSSSSWCSKSKIALFFLPLPILTK